MYVVLGDAREVKLSVCLTIRSEDMRDNATSPVLFSKHASMLDDRSPILHACPPSLVNRLKRRPLRIITRGDAFVIIFLFNCPLLDTEHPLIVGALC